MDFEILFWLLFLLAPVLSRLLRGKGKKDRPPAPRPTPRQEQASSRELTPFEEALRQIQETLTEGRVADTRPASKPLETVSPRKLPEPPVRKLEGFRTQERVAAPRFFDDAFEKAAASSEPGADQHFHEALGEKESDQPLQRRRRQKDMSKWRNAVKNVVILNEPRSRSRWTPPGA